MFTHYIELAVRSLRRNLVLTALIIAAVAIGIGTSMTVLTTLRAMSADPIPAKSSQLFAVQIDNWGPENRTDDGEPPDQLSWRDSSALLEARRGVRQVATYGVAFAVTPTSAGEPAFAALGRATSPDFFAMFDTPFRSGNGWSDAEEDARANVVVLGARLAERLFGREDPVGRTIDLDQQSYRIVGVLGQWDPRPHFYDLTTGHFAESDDVYVPLRTAIERQLTPRGNTNCNTSPGPGFDGRLQSECVWTQFWVELPTAADAARYREFLDAYASEQQRNGRFAWPPLTRLRDVRAWLVFNDVVSDEARVNTLVAFGFLLVCLVNAVGLLLARFSSRAGEMSVRRALGASRRDLFQQCLVESAVIGLAGGVLGLGVAALGLAAERAILPEDLTRLAHLDAIGVALTLALAMVAMTLVGLYPTWRASRVQPAWQLKSQ